MDSLCYVNDITYTCGNHDYVNTLVQHCYNKRFIFVKDRNQWKLPQENVNNCVLTDKITHEKWQVTIFFFFFFFFFLKKQGYIYFFLNEFFLQQFKLKDFKVT